MARSSHMRCKVCRVITHSRHRFGMCQRCSDKHQARLAEQRKQTQERRARRNAAMQAALTSILEEDLSMTDTETETPDKTDRRTRYTLTEDQQVQILDAYTTTTEPVQDICNRFGIKHTYIYNVLDRVGVSWRRGNPESFATWQANQARQAEAQDDTVPAPQRKALERMLLPPRPEPVAPTPAVDRRVRVVDDVETNEEWTVTVQGIVHARGSLEHVIAELRRTQPGLSIVKLERM